MAPILSWLRAEWDRATGVLVLIVGAVALVLGYQGVANSPYVAEQLAYVVSGGIGGLFLLGVGAILLLSADLQDEWRKLDRIEACLNRLAPEPLTTPDAPGADADGSHPAATPALETGPIPDALPLPRQGITGIAVAGLVVAAGIVGVGWVKAATSAPARQAISGTAIAVLGLVVCGVCVAGSTLWLRRSVRGRAAALLGTLSLDALLAPVSQAPGTAGAGAPIRFVAGRGLRRYHRAACAAIVGLETYEVDPASTPLKPCGLCVRDQ